MEFLPLTEFVSLMMLEDPQHEKRMMNLLFGLRVAVTLMQAGQPCPLVQDLQLFKGSDPLKNYSGSPLPYPLRR